jgi:hypothetical protein
MLTEVLMLIRFPSALCATAVVLLAGALPAAAQIRGSERASVSQTLDGTTLTLEYSRPRAAGRELFGGLVPFDSPWTGANWATTLEVDKDVRLNGAAVPAGKYSVWIVPRAERSWTVFLDPEAELFHFQKPDSSPEQIRMAVEPAQGAHSEMLTWTFPAVSGDAALLQMQWGSTAVPLQVEVQPTMAEGLPAEARRSYVGTYDMTMMEGIGWPTTGQLEIYEEEGQLRARLPFPIHPGDDLEFDMVPAGRDRFNAGLYRGGEFFNVEMGATFEFDLAGESAMAVRFRGIEGTVFAEGVRGGP